jgi:hypothetical protein
MKPVVPAFISYNVYRPANRQGQASQVGRIIPVKGFGGGIENSSSIPGADP